MYTVRTQTEEIPPEAVLEEMKPSITPYTRHTKNCNSADRNSHKCGCPIWFFNPALPRGRQRYSAGTNDWNEAMQKASRLRDARKAYHLDMRRLHPECSDSESSDRSLPADILLRKEPENEEEEDDEEHDGDEEDGDGDDGYSE
jgi:hypothetical protein